MNCTEQGCAKSWNPGEEFPLCISLSGSCPLRDYYVSEQRLRLRWSSSSQSRIQLTQCASHTATAISEIQDIIDERYDFVPYKMGGKQSATTTVATSAGPMKFTTTEQMHSEIQAISYMLENGLWTLYLGHVVCSGKPVKPADFKTTEPHCGFCTILLQVLGLPLTKPTKGNFNLAVNCNYPLPHAIKTNPWVLARILDKLCYCGFNKLKELINPFISLPKEKWLLVIKDLASVSEISYEPVVNQMPISWDQVMAHNNGEILNAIWAHIFKAIYEQNSK